MTGEKTALDSQQGESTRECHRGMRTHPSQNVMELIGASMTSLHMGQSNGAWPQTRWLRTVDDLYHQHLRELLAEDVATIQVGTPPLDAVHDRGRRIFRRRSVIIATTAVVVVVAGLGTSLSLMADRQATMTRQNSDRPSESTTERTDLPPNVIVRRATAPDIDVVPEAFLSLAHVLSGLVESHASHFSGAWFDSKRNMMAIGFATRHGHDLLRDRGLLKNDRVVVVPAELSSADGFRFASRLAGADVPDGTVAMGSLNPQGDGFVIGVYGEVIAPIILQLAAGFPGRVIIETGFVLDDGQDPDDSES